MAPVVRFALASVMMATPFFGSFSNAARTSSVVPKTPSGLNLISGKSASLYSDVNLATTVMATTVMGRGRWRSERRVLV